MLNKFIKVAFMLLPLMHCAQAMHSSEDKFDFLRTQYPQLLEKAQAPFQQCYEEKQHYQKLKSLANNRQTTPQQVLMSEIHKEMNKTTLTYFGPEYEKFVLDQLDKFILPLAHNHPQHGYYKIYFERALKNHTILEDILLSAEYLYQVVKDQQGTNILFLGRTPCLLQVAYEEVCGYQEDKEQRVLHLNFSGHPDALTKRESIFFITATNIARDMVTVEKLQHYFSYLDTKDIVVSNKLFVVDTITSGGSLNSFLRILYAYFQLKRKPIPDVVFLNLSQDVNWSIERSEFYTFTQSGETINKGTLSLHEDVTKNMKRFDISAFGIPIFGKVLTEILDQDMFQEFLVHGIQYPAQKWTPQFDTQREVGGAYHQEFYDYLRSNFRDLIKTHILDYKTHE